MTGPSRIVVTPHRVTYVAWRAPFAVAIEPVDAIAAVAVNTPLVTVVLEPGESRSLRVGEREYVTVKRAGQLRLGGRE